jgi:benzoate 4-monooxygenase
MVVINISSLDRGLVIPLALLTAISYTLYILIYRLFFSPLSKIPGPWQTRITSFLEVNALKEQRRTRWVSELFEQNPGAVAVRTGPSSVSFNHPDAVKAIYGRSSFVFLDPSIC